MERRPIEVDIKQQQIVKGIVAKVGNREVMRVNVRIDILLGNVKKNCQKLLQAESFVKLAVGSRVFSVHCD